MFLVILERGTESSRHGRGRGPERALRHIETDDERSVQGGWRDATPSSSVDFSRGSPKR